MHAITAQYALAILVDTHAPSMALSDKFIFTCAPISIQANIEKDYLLLCVKSVYNNAPRSLPNAPSWLNSNNPKHLEDAENLCQNISLYAWLSFKFPQIFVDANRIPAYRSQINQYISRALLIQSGYGDTTREIDYLSRNNR